MKGTVFDIKQMAVFDGPGIRSTVFLKGCPLRCKWCHNPEGLSYFPQLMVSKSACIHCGKCEEICEHPKSCIHCGRCVRECALGLRRICGRIMESEELVQKILKDNAYLSAQNGGVTFSGGEPTAQPEFLLECLKMLSCMHRAIETSGYCKTGWFCRILEELDYVIMDIKLVDEERHRYFTGVGNQLILKNLECLKKSKKPFRIRIPVIPTVNDSRENFRATAELLAGADRLEKVELLPYHQTAGAKYEMIGARYQPEFDTLRMPNLDMEPFEALGIPCECL